ncbi:RNA-directed DNA polymerase (Reverse transcriptase), partial [Trifolium medium]|nr:RNA-directed DNA polymerase (Reverse transcriptase) [Trifolium medium]
MNQDCLIKLGWKFFSGANDYWCTIMRGKYTHEEAKPSDSNLWKVMFGLKHHVWNSCSWIVGDGCDIEAWNHAWIDEGLCLAQHVTIPPELQGAKVCDLVDSNGSWNWSLMQNWMPRDLQNKIAAILPPHHDHGRDVLAGAVGNSADFSVAAMHNKLCGFDMDEVDLVWSKIWKLSVTERVKSFVWRVLWDRLLTNVLKYRMGLSSPICSYCGREEETSLHALRDCPLVSQFWIQVVKVERRGIFFMSSLKDWVSENINNTCQVDGGIVWCNFWALACFCLWNWRNKELHEHNFMRPTNPVQHVVRLGKEYIRTMRMNSVIKQRTMVNTCIRWKPPRDKFMKLNTDGACKEGRRAGCGGIIRGNQGEWIGGFAKGIGYCSAFIAELWGVLE